MPGDVYVVGMFTMGSFKGWCTDPMTLAECREFVADPPQVWAPRPQDALCVFELVEINEDEEKDS
ncbi:MAG: hypothetical protein ACRDXE_09035 [Acidimicrobiales bacterium]